MQLATYAQSGIPKPRVKRVLYSNVFWSEFQDMDFCGELRRCEHLFSLTGKIRSFSQIEPVGNVSTVVLQFTSKAEEETKD